MQWESRTCAKVAQNVITLNGLKAGLGVIREIGEESEQK